jgi:hypothetical protein
MERKGKTALHSLTLCSPPKCCLKIHAGLFIRTLAFHDTGIIVDPALGCKLVALYLGLRHHITDAQQGAALVRKPRKNTKVGYPCMLVEDLLPGLSIEILACLQ